jgi:SPP1 family phage portal protein
VSNSIERIDRSSEADVTYAGVYTHGRRRIYTSEDLITEENILQVVNEALMTHAVNATEEKYLSDYRRGITPILQRTKERNAFICNKVNENHAEEICAFKNGYFLSQPSFYTSRNGKSQSKVNKLNEYLYRSGKHIADNKVVDSFHTVGIGVLYVEPGEDDDTPVRCYAMNPLQAFVVYSLRPGNKPMLGISMVMGGARLYIDAYTKDKCYRIIGSPASVRKVVDGRMVDGIATAQAVYKVDENAIGEIPIIEYRYNSLDMCAFEAALPLLDALDELASDRLDGVGQFIQSLMVIYGADLPDGETAETMKSKGILVLPRMGDGTQADVKILSEELNQSQTQTLVDWTYRQILRVCSMPDTTKGGTSTSDTASAVFLRDGFANAQVCARNTEDLFRESNAYFDRILLKILEGKQLIKGLKISDFELNFVRNETSGMYEKAQALNLLLNSGVEPTLAFGKSGVSNDPNADVKMSEKWLKMKWGDPDAPTADKPDTMGADEGSGEPLEPAEAMDNNLSVSDGESVTEPGSDQEGGKPQTSHYVKGYWRD